MTVSRFDPAAPGFIARAVARLSFIEAWERYSFFTLFTLLPLFVAAPLAKGGLGWSPGGALRFFGAYLLAVQIAPVAGGWIADHWLGAKAALRGGATALMLGHIAMAAATQLRSVPAAFYLSVALVAIGNGLFKPVLTVVVGRLPHADNAARNAAFTTFFLYLNIGGLASLVLGGWLAERLGWVWAFAASASGMAIAIVAMSVLEPAYIRPFVDRSRRGGGSGAVAGPDAPTRWPIGVALAFLTYMVVCSFSYQSYGFVNLFTARLVDRDVAGFAVPPSWFAALNPLTILVVSPLLVMLWGRRGLGYDWRPTTRVAASLAGMAVAFGLLAAAARQVSVVGLASPIWVVVAIMLIATAELLFTPALNSAVTRLLPVRHQNVGIGGLAASAGVGAWFSGRIGAIAMEGDMAAVLPMIAAGALVAAGLLITARAPLARLTL